MNGFKPLSYNEASNIISNLSIVFIDTFGHGQGRWRTHTTPTRAKSSPTPTLFQLEGSKGLATMWVGDFFFALSF